MPRLLLLPLLLGVLVTASPAALAQSGIISGRVVDATSGDPIPGASVVISGTPRGVATSDDGTFVLSEVPAGAHTLTASSVGYETVSRTIRVPAGETVRVELALAPVAFELGDVVVSSGRLRGQVAALPGAVTVLGPEELEAQRPLSVGLGDLLAREVPGLGVTTQSVSNWGQTLRGRNVVVLIDGVPQSTSRNVLRDLSTLDPEVVERVEVYRGATALYGDGATGGVINILTRTGRSGAPRITAGAQVEASLSAPGDGFGSRLLGGAAGATGGWDYAVTGVYRASGLYYDATGAVIPPDPHGQGGLADAESWNVHGKVGLALGPQRRLQFTASTYRFEQDSRYTSDPTVGAEEPGSVRSRAVEGLELSEPPGTQNTLASLDYFHGGVLGGVLHAQVYARDYTTRFAPWDARSYLGVVAQSFVESTKLGGRLDVETALPLGVSGSKVVWGLDLVREETGQPLTVYDAQVYDESGGRVFTATGDVLDWVPPIRQLQVAAFAQVELRPVERLALRAGLRHEQARVEVDDFSTVVGNSVTGGMLTYAPLLLNAGVIVDATASLQAFAGFAQGFSLSDVGRVLRGAADGLSLEAMNVQAQTVNNLEAGLALTQPTFEAAITGFYNTSELGTTLDAQLNVVRSPERVYGVEMAADARPLAGLSVGGVFNWTEGENDADRDRVFLALDGFRIQPWKLSAYGQYGQGPWSVRLQALHSGSRERAFQDGVAYGGRLVEAYTVVDVLASYRIGPGVARAGVANLLNADYFPAISQLLPSGNPSFTAARGATLTVGYTVTL